MLAPRVGLARQKVNYHLRELERHGLVELVEERRKGNVTERVMRATAASFVISPAALAAVAPDPDRSADKLSARWLLALAARLVRDVGELITKAGKARKPLATLVIDGEVRFASAADRAASRRTGERGHRAGGEVSRRGCAGCRTPGHRRRSSAQHHDTPSVTEPATKRAMMGHDFETDNEITVDATLRRCGRRSRRGRASTPGSWVAIPSSLTSVAERR
jgi:DNA-binding transcriptional ArsR family regulator